MPSERAEDNGRPKTCLFVVVGAQRTGTNILREILNTNERIAMLGEVLSPSEAPSYWGNFIASRGLGWVPPTLADTESLLGRYLEFIEYRIRNHWVDGDKRGCTAIGMDIKYSQLREIAPAGWSSEAPPYLLGYLRARNAIIVHAVRRNVIQCAISAMIAEQRGVWHNYAGSVIDGSYRVDTEQCLASARAIVRQREQFLKCSEGLPVVTSCYEDLVNAIAQRDPAGHIPEVAEPLRSIARALGVTRGFRYATRLRKAINVPYARLVSNYAELVDAVTRSEFAHLAPSLD